MRSIFACRWWRNALAIATFATIVLPIPSRAAERLVTKFPPFKDLVVSVRDLETFARGGQIPPAFAQLTGNSSPTQVQQVREFLQQRFEVSPTYISQLTTWPVVQRLLARLSGSIRADPGADGGKALQTALVKAANTPGGLTVVSFLRAYPSQQIDLDLNEIFTIYDNLNEYLKRRDRVVLTLDRLAQSEAASNRSNLSQTSDLHRAGTFGWHKQSFSWLDRARNRLVPGDLYLPTTNTKAPVIVISHGVAGDRTTLGYLARHLASYGFGVATIEHVGGNANRFWRYFAGLTTAPAATEFLNRPRDVSFVLDEIQRRAITDPRWQRLDPQQAGVIGQSLGGYTVLALGGAEINFDRLQRDCYPDRSLNLSVFLQCRATELPRQRYALQDRRIKAVFALNPIASSIFGAQGIATINVPTFLLAGGEDIVAPAVPEQIYPFTWLQTPNKYLAVFDRGTHFSVLDDRTESVFPISTDLVGADPTVAQNYVRALGTAFFQRYLANRPQFAADLTAAYGKSLEPSAITASTNLNVIGHNRPTLQLNLVGATAAPAITDALDRDPGRAPKLER